MYGMTEPYETSGHEPAGRLGRLGRLAEPSGLC
jgi:hypothetical protein